MASNPRALENHGEVSIVVTSRMSSTRLPGKALWPIADTPLLRRVVDQCRQSEAALSVFLVTSTEPSDRAIVEYCHAVGIDYYSGSLNDVIARILALAEERRLQALVRISGDSPLFDPALIDYGLHLFKRGNFDLVTNVQSRTFPKGQSVEVIRTDLLQKLASHQLTEAHREHVTSAVYQGLVPARIRNFTSEELAPEHFNAFAERGIDLACQNLSVDTLDDAAHVEKIIRSIHPMTPAQAGWVRCTEAHLQVAVEGK